MRDGAVLALRIIGLSALGFLILALCHWHPPQPDDVFVAYRKGPLTDTVRQCVDMQHQPSACLIEYR
jgi:hypothetical protein